MTHNTMDDAATMRPGGVSVLGRIDKYELVRELGEGGFGTVYLAGWRKACRARAGLRPRGGDPFVDGAPLAGDTRHVRDTSVPADAPEIPPSQPKNVYKALATALAKNPEERFATCGDFVAALPLCESRLECTFVLRELLWLSPLLLRDAAAMRDLL